MGTITSVFVLSGKPFLALLELKLRALDRWQIEPNDRTGRAKIWSVTVSVPHERTC